VVSRRRRLVGPSALVLASIIALCACGARHGDLDAARPAVTTPTTEPVTSEQLEEALLMPSDLPESFDIETSADPAEGTDANLTAVDPRCQPALDDLATDSTGSLDLPRAGVTFEQAHEVRVSQQLSLAPDATERFANARGVLRRGCDRTVDFRIDGGSGRYRLVPGPRLGDDTIYLRSHLRTGSEETPATFDGFIVLTRVGDVVSTVSVHSAQVPALDISAPRAPRLGEASALARRATRHLRRALR
jgi:hypothetical protein